MLWLRTFVADESAVAEATPRTLFLAVVVLLLVGALLIWHVKVQSFFTNAGGNMEGAAVTFILPGRGNGN